LTSQQCQKRMIRDDAKSGKLFSLSSGLMA
jgi:hypothetical protein